MTMWRDLALIALAFWVERLRNLQPLILRLTPRGLLRVTMSEVSSHVVPSKRWMLAEIEKNAR